MALHPTVKPVERWRGPTVKKGRAPRAARLGAQTRRFARRRFFRELSAFVRRGKPAFMDDPAPECFAARGEIVPRIDQFRTPGRPLQDLRQTLDARHGFHRCVYKW